MATLLPKSEVILGVPRIFGTKKTLFRAPEPLCGDYNWIGWHFDRGLGSRAFIVSKKKELFFESHTRGGGLENSSPGFIYSRSLWWRVWSRWLDFPHCLAKKKSSYHKTGGQSTRRWGGNVRNPSSSLNKLTRSRIVYSALVVKKPRHLCKLFYRVVSLRLNTLDVSGKRR